MKVTQSIHLMQDGDAFSNDTEDEADLTALNIFYLEIVALILRSACYMLRIGRLRNIKKET